MTSKQRGCLHQYTDGVIGEISFCGAIEIAGEITINFKVMKGGQKELGMVNGKSPMYIPGPVETQFGPGRYLYFEVS